MFGRFKKYNKWLEYINVSNLEVKAGILITLLFIILAERLNLYHNVSLFIPLIQNILLYLVAGFIGLLGLIIAGVAIVIGMFNQQQLIFIKKVTRKDIMGHVLTSFEFMAFNIGILICYLLGTYLCTAQLTDPVPEVFIMASSTITVYMTVFSLFYCVGLVSNCISLYFIRDTYEGVIVSEGELEDVINNLKIEFILHIIVKKFGITPGDFMTSLITFIDENDVENKEEIKQHLAKIYNVS